MQTDSSSTVTTEITSRKHEETIPYGFGSRFLMQQQELINRHAMCIRRLREVATEVDALRLDNSALRSLNVDLNNRLALILGDSMKKQCSLSSDDEAAPFDVSSLCGSGSDDNFEEGESSNSVKEVSPPTVVAERVSLPKSISVRSTGYLKMNQDSCESVTRGMTRPRTVSPLDGARKVYVHGGKPEEGLELEVYNQGMFKTELCNKWEATGACPYGDHCQFAHGIEELRPVIRHPRYKTEICRMVQAGDICPYGHRCHFRHALTEQDRSIAATSGSIKIADRYI